jgi:ferredoxin/flavodoxin---NADP+ reductase
VPIEGVPFDPATSTVNNIAGQITHPNTGEVAPGEYVAGWAKRGPTGRIGNNKPDSISTVAAMVADLGTLKGVRDDQRHPSRVESLLRRRGIRYASYQDWRTLDAHERARGAAHGRPRVKLTTVPEMLEVIDRARE